MTTIWYRSTQLMACAVPRLEYMRYFYHCRLPAACVIYPMISVAQPSLPCPCAPVPLSHAGPVARICCAWTARGCQPTIHLLRAPGVSRACGTLRCSKQQQQRPSERHRMYTKAGYGMHLVALCVQVSAVSVVVVHWSTALW